MSKSRLSLGGIKSLKDFLQIWLTLDIFFHMAILEKVSRLSNGLEWTSESLVFSLLVYVCFLMADAALMMIYCFALYKNESVISETLIENCSFGALVVTLGSLIYSLQTWMSLEVLAGHTLVKFEYMKTTVFVLLAAHFVTIILQAVVVRRLHRIYLKLNQTVLD